MSCKICDKDLSGEINHVSSTYQTKKIDGYSFMGGWMCFECSDLYINDLKEKRKMSIQKYRCIECKKVFNYDQIINLPHTPRYKFDLNVSVCHQCLVDAVLESIVSVDIISAHSKELGEMDERLDTIENTIENKELEDLVDVNTTDIRFIEDRLDKLEDQD